MFDFEQSRRLPSNLNIIFTVKKQALLKLDSLSYWCTKCHFFDKIIFKSLFLLPILILANNYNLKFSGKNMLKVVFVVMMLMTAIQASAEELFVVINGKSIHNGNTKYNEDNWGLGFEYDMKPDKQWIPFVAGSTFKDSNDQTSNYLGGGYKYRIPLENEKEGWRIDLSLIAFLMTRKDYRDNQPFVGALPFVAIGTSKVMLNVTYIPKVTPKSAGLFYFQLKFKLMEFE